MTYPNLANKPPLEPSLAEIIDTQPIIIFDGVCNFCDGAVNFIIKHDPNSLFRFTTVQSDTGQALINAYGLEHLNNETLVLIKGEQYFIYSSAAFAIAQELTWPYRALGWLRFLPKSLCDYGYKLFARHRYAMFGKKDQCMMPSKDIKSRFLE